MSDLTKALMKGMRFGFIVGVGVYVSAWLVELIDLYIP